MGLIPKLTNLSNRLLFNPALAVSLLLTTGPNYLWSPTNITYYEPCNNGNKHSGSIAYVASSINTYSNLNHYILGSLAAIHVVHITSAFFNIS